MGQHGLITLGQATGCGLTEGQVRHLVTRGHWRRLRRGVYVVGGAPSTREQVWLAAVLAAGDGAVLSHGTALQHWGLELRAEAVEVTTARDRRRVLTGVVVHRSVSIGSLDVTRRAGIPLTTLGRALVDVSARLGRGPLGPLLDDGVRRGLTTYEGVERSLRRVGPAPGRHPSVMVELLGERLPGFDPGDSQAEARLARLLRGAGYLVEVHHVVVAGGRRFELDLALPHERVGLEFQSFAFHRTRTPFDRDLDKRLLLQLEGWTTVEVGDRTGDALLLAAVERAVERQRRLAG